MCAHVRLTLVYSAVLLRCVFETWTMSTFGIYSLLLFLCLTFVVSLGSSLSFLSSNQGTCGQCHQTA